jgi:hypothetical protein
MLALMLITDLSELMAQFLVTPLGNVNFVAVQEKYTQQWLDLIRFGLVAEVRPAELRFCSRYFAIAKHGVTTTARCIFNGRALSRHFKVPPSVNLPEVPFMLREMSRIHRERNHHGKHRLPSFFAADLRHWFHQIPVAAAVRSLFGLYGPDHKYYQWATLPMG